MLSRILDPQELYKLKLNVCLEIEEARRIIWVVCSSLLQNVTIKKNPARERHN
jgi:hypothetical protein